jgi:hypothetical protein
VSTADIKKPSRCKDATEKEASRAWIKTHKRFIFAEEFFLRAQSLLFVSCNPEIKFN